MKWTSMRGRGWVEQKSTSILGRGENARILWMSFMDCPFTQLIGWGGSGGCVGLGCVIKWVAVCCDNYCCNYSVIHVDYKLLFVVVSSNPVSTHNELHEQAAAGLSSLETTHTHV